MTLNEKQRKFAELYIQTGHIRDSYKKAGYASIDNNAVDANAQKLMNRPEVVAYMAMLRNKVASRKEITIEKVIDRLAKIAFGEEELARINDDGELELVPGADVSLADGITFSKSGSENSSDSGSGSSQSKSVSIRSKDSIRALDQLSKLMGFYEKRNNEHSRSLEANAGRVLEALRRLKGSK